MFKVLVEDSSRKGLYVQITDGRILPLEVIVEEYERLSKKEHSQKAMTSELEDEGVIIPKLEPGKWFRINRDVIDGNKREIYNMCVMAGAEGKAYWKKFTVAEGVAAKNPDKYPRVMDVYIYNLDWYYKSEQEMQNMCEQDGDGICDEVICYWEIQMRMCNGESTDTLFKKADELPYKRFIRCRNGKAGFFGGGAVKHDFCPPAHFFELYNFSPDNALDGCVPYMFRKVSSEN